MQIKVVYQSNYNGCSVTIGGISTDKCEQIEDAIVNRFYDDCDCGEFVGNDQDVVDFATKLIKAEFGSDADVSVVIDNSSS